MKLYFEKFWEGQRRLIAQPQTKAEVMQEIHKFIDKCNEDKPEDKKFHSYYCRTWENEEGLIVYDVGSHSEFFLLKSDEEEG